MNSLDIFILIPLVYGAYRGFKKGFLLEIVSILALILGVLGGLKLLQWGMEILADNFDINSVILPYITFIILFITIIIGINFIGKLIKKMIDMTILGSVDNLAGSILGLFKWALAISLLLWISGSFGINIPEKYTDDTVIYPVVAALAPSVIGFLTLIFPFVEEFYDSAKSLLN